MKRTLNPLLDQGRFKKKGITAMQFIEYWRRFINYHPCSVAFFKLYEKYENPKNFERIVIFI